MFKFSKKQSLILVASMFAAFVFGYSQLDLIDDASSAVPVNVEGVEAIAKLKKIEAIQQEDQKLGQFILNMMVATKADLSPERKQIVARSIVKIANEILPRYEDRKTFVTMVAIESRFNRNAKSPTGAVGMAQIIPSYANDHGAPCGITNIKTEDLYDTETNLALGACYLRFLLERYDGEPLIALAGYNAGHNSKTAAVYAKSGDMDNQETLKYIAKYVFLMNHTSDSKPLAKNVAEKK